MEKVDFDKYAEEYDKVLKEDLEFFGEENNYFAEYKVKIVKNETKSLPARILEYGCGIGRNIEYFTKMFPQSKITGCDISQKSLELSKKRNPTADFFLISDVEVNKHQERFDIIFISCVLHHIEPRLRNEVMGNIAKMLNSGGELYIFEHNPLNPVTRKIVRECIWDEDAILLYPKESLNLVREAGLELIIKKYSLFFPSQLKALRGLEKFINFLPVGGQYYIIAKKR